MRNKTFRFAVSVLAVSLMTAGCQSDDTRPAALSAEAPKSDHDALRLSQQAQAAARKGAVADAQDLMEQAVALAPRDAGYRMTLAEIYLRSGRFVSAERTFSDVIILDPDNAQASIYLGLSRAAQGKALAAQAALEKAEGRAAPGDLGLAYALTGDHRRAIDLLEDATRKEGADARIRQNLALAYALAGDWTKARSIAAQDVSPFDLDRRMEQWARLARPSGGGLQVASFLGVTAVEDEGQPVRLALQVEDAPVYAEAEPVSGPQTASTDMNAASAYIVPATIPAEMAVQTAEPVMAPALPVARVAGSAAQTYAALPKSRPLAVRNGRYVVQIGAFGSRTQAEIAWKSAQRRYGFAEGRRIITTIAAPQGKGVFHRLAVGGFETSTDASRACGGLKAKGGQCFVRPVSGAPTRMASRS